MHQSVQNSRDKSKIRALLVDSVRLFVGLNDSELDSLLAVSKPISVKARSTVCRKGEPGDALYIVISGKLKVAAMSEDGREAILAILEDGETFGEMSLLDEHPRSANVVAVQDSELLVIQRQDFSSYLVSHPKAAISLLGILCRRLRLMDDMMEDMRFLDIRSRLAKTLSRLALQHGRTAGNGSIRLDLKLSQEDLGGLICATRESVNKHLKAWEEEGVLDLSQNGFVIHRLAELELVSGGQ
jgi:CRP/FNR family cyclic AMP-dependent transcriptional regulator